ncbi:MAG: DinB family protein [Nitrososphaerota archaeon]|nr:DinB family protein [Nitrososphaerota archaeon]
MMEIRELFTYSATVRSKFANKLAELPRDLVEKNREASFYSMKNILLHIIDNEDWIVNYAIFEKTKEYKRRKWEEYTSMEMLLEHLREVEKKTRDYLDRTNDAELKHRVKFELSSGKTYDLTVEECLFQSFTEQLYHLGELIALMWQENIEPPTMQWFNNNPRS